MKVQQTLPNPSLEACCDDSQKCITLGSSCSSIDSNEQEPQPISRVQRSRSFRGLTGKIANAIKAGSLKDPNRFNKNSSKPVRARLVLKKNGGDQPSLGQPQTPSKSGRKVLVRRKSFFGMTKNLNSSASLDADTHAVPKRRSVTPSRASRNQASAPVTPSKKATFRISSKSETNDQMPAKKINLLQCCRSVQRDTRLTAVKSPLQKVSRASREFLQRSQRNLSVQEIIDEYNKIAGEEPEQER